MANVNGTGKGFRVQHRDDGDIYIGPPADLVAASVLTPEQLPPASAGRRVFTYFNGALTSRRPAWCHRDGRWMSVCWVNGFEVRVMRWLAPEVRQARQQRHHEGSESASPDAAINAAIRATLADFAEECRRLKLAKADRQFQAWLSGALGFALAPSSTPHRR